MPQLFNEEDEPLPNCFEKLVQKLKLQPGATLNEFVFLCVVYNVLELGFIVSCENMNNFETYDFNNKALQCTGELELKDIYQKHDGQFESHLRLGAQSEDQIYLTGHPSHSKSDDFIVVNLRTSPQNEITSICILTSQYCTESNFVIKHRSKFSLDVKNDLAWPIKSYWMQRNLQGNYPHYSAMPYPVVKLVKSYRARKITNRPYSGLRVM